MFIAEIWPRFQLSDHRLGWGPLPTTGPVKQERAGGGYLGSKPQSCERMLGARLQVRPVPSGSTFRDLTMPSSITMENLPERRAGPRQTVPLLSSPLSLFSHFFLVCVCFSASCALASFSSPSSYSSLFPFFPSLLLLFFRLFLSSSKFGRK